MNRNTLLAAVLLCSALGFAALQFFTPQENSDIKIEQRIEQTVPADTVSGGEKTQPNIKQEEAAQPVEGSVKDTASRETQAVAEKKADKSYIYIKKSDFTLCYYDNSGKEIFRAGCALGLNPGQKEKEGDMKTPSGTFYVDEILDASYWTHDFGDGKGEIQGAYGPWFISINTDEMSKGQWGGIGIHGTHDPASIGKRASEGCIRLENSQVEILKQLVSVGTKVVIEE